MAKKKASKKKKKASKKKKKASKKKKKAQEPEPTPRRVRECDQGANLKANRREVI